MVHHQDKDRRCLAAGDPDAHQPVTTRSNISIVNRGAVIDAEVAIQALIARLSSHQPVASQGVAMVERLITDGVASPLYNEARPGRCAGRCSRPRSRSN